MNWFASLGVGLGVGVVYGMLGLRSPAPPLIALLGLLGMLAGEQATAIVKHYVGRAPPASVSDLGDRPPGKR